MTPSHRPCIQQTLLKRETGVELRHTGFTLVELLVVIIIISILSAMTLGGMASAAKSSRTQTTTLLIRRLSDSILERCEEYEDLAVSRTTVVGLVSLRAQMREEMPDSWADVFDLTSGSAAPARSGLPAPKTCGMAYARYKDQRRITLSKQFQSSECLYMIITVSGFFPDFMENVRPERVGDVDGDGAKEFLDGWGNPIAFMRWAPGFSSPYSPIQFNVPADYHDPIDDAGLDLTAFALYPLVYSPGIDGEYGLLASDTGWPDANLGVASPSTPCTFNPGGDGLVGSPNPTAGKENDFRDNITNHSLFAQ